MSDCDGVEKLVLEVDLEVLGKLSSHGSGVDVLLVDAEHELVWHIVGHFWGGPCDSRETQEYGNLHGVSVVRDLERGRLYSTC